MKSINKIGLLLVTGLLLVGTYGCSGGGGTASPTPGASGTAAPTAAATP